MKRLNLIFLAASAALVASVSSFFVEAAEATYPIPSSCANGVPNPFPIYEGEPIFVRSIQNAQLYVAGTGNDTFQVLHLWGTPYEKGYAQGKLMAKEVAAVTEMINQYIAVEIEKYLPMLPKDIVDLIVEYGVDTMLLWTYEWTLPYMRKSFVDEMNGIADGSGVDIKLIRMYNMYPELTKAACTIVGANGPSTPNKLINQLRALDIGPDIPIKNYAQVTVYHSNDGDTESTTFMTVGWTAMVGALTGFSAKGVGIGEKLWFNAPKGVDSVNGEPWMFILRNVLERTSAMPEALDLVQTANRTCSIHVGIGTSSDNTFRGLEIAAKAFNVYNDSSLNYTGHPRIPGVVYWNKHVQPSKDSCLADLLSQYKDGQITAEVLATQVAPIAQTGDFHTVTFDYGAKMAFIANSRKTYVTEGSDNGYMRQFTRLDMGKLFNVKQ